MQLTNIGDIQKALSRATDFFKEESTGGKNYIRFREGEFTSLHDPDLDIDLGSQWVVNPNSLKLGYSSFNDRKRVKVGEEMRSLFQTPVKRANLPDTGYDWEATIAFEMRCTEGTCIKGRKHPLVGEYNTRSKGGVEAAASLCQQVLNHEGKELPIVELDTTFYVHKGFNKTIHKPVFTVVGWLPMSELEEYFPDFRVDLTQEDLDAMQAEQPAGALEAPPEPAEPEPQPSTEPVKPRARRTRRTQ